MFHPEDIYYSLLGEFINGAEVPGVENLFTSGSPCDLNYTQMTNAYKRLCHHLNQASEDPDVEIIINALLENQRLIALKMYEYGAKKSRS